MNQMDSKSPGSSEPGDLLYLSASCYFPKKIFHQFLYRWNISPARYHFPSFPNDGILTTHTMFNDVFDLMIHRIN